jgi:hypothetical protein
MRKAAELIQLTARIPHDQKAWLAEQSRINASSENSELVRAIRERMERETNARSRSPG